MVTTIKEEKQEIITSVYKKLNEHFSGINLDNVEVLCNEAFNAKKQINDILGLNEENQFRHEILVEMTSQGFKDFYPNTINFFNAVAEGKNYSVVDNNIDIDSKQKMRFTRFLSKNKNKIEELKQNYCLSVCNELNIRSLDDIFIFRDKLKQKKCVISTNPYDIITATEGSTFTSCYRFNGEYFNSTIALCRSPQAALIYLYDNDQTRKIGRAWVYLFPNEKKFIMLKPYGSFYETERKTAREYIELKLSENFQIDNKWKKQTLCSYKNYSGHTQPIYFDSQNITFVRHKDSDKEQEAVTLPEAVCLYCGDETTNEKGGGCENCAEDRYNCEDCGCSLSENDYYSDDDGYYCNACYYERYFYCESCGDDYHLDEENYVDDQGSYCNDCYKDNFYQCYDCASDLDKENDSFYVSAIDGETYCENCYFERYSCCKECDTELKKAETKEFEDKSYCEDCYSQILEEVKKHFAELFCEHKLLIEPPIVRDPKTPELVLDDQIEKEAGRVLQVA